MKQFKLPIIFTFLLTIFFANAAPHPTDDVDTSPTLIPKPINHDLSPVTHEVAAGVTITDIRMIWKPNGDYVFHIGVPRDNKVHWVINLKCYRVTNDPKLMYGLYNCSNLEMITLYLGNGGPCVFFDSMSWPIWLGATDFLRDAGRGTHLLRAVCCGDNCTGILREEDGGPLPMARLV